MSIFDRFRRKDEQPVDTGVIDLDSIPAEEGLPEAERVLPIGDEQVRKAQETLDRYKRGKVHLDERIIEAEDFWRLRRADKITVKGTGTKTDPRFAGAQTWNCVTSKHADAMDAYPEPNMRPRMKDDVEEAKRLTEVIPIVLERNGFRDVYSKIWWKKLKEGSAIYGVFWDGQAINGQGDIAVRVMDTLRLAWEPGITDIQDSANIFYETLVDNERLKEMYPELKDQFGKRNRAIKRRHQDDNVDDTDKSVVVDWYYKKNGLLHYCKYCGEVVLFATENEPEKYPRGMYDHGMYPFVVDVLFPVEDSIAGNGLYDVAKQTQEQIDTLNQAIVKNAAFGAKPRFFYRGEGGVNLEEFTDPEKDLVRVDGSLDETALRQIAVNPFSSIFLELLNYKTEELKEVTGNRDVANGGSTSGVTAGAAIAALQESSGKLSRDSNAMSYEAFSRVINLVIELIRQFYTMPRWFMITGEGGEEEFVSYDNSKLQPQLQAETGGYRLPVFDIKVSAQKATPYTKMAQNELALQLLGAGFFTPGNERQSLSCLDMMDFDGKDDVRESIERNDMVMQTAMLALQMARRYEPALVPQIAQALGMPLPGMGAPSQGAPTPQAAGDGTVGGESKHMVDARAQAQEAHQPR